jgi:radical SAM family RiPP maturation amino acid epimerase
MNERTATIADAKRFLELWTSGPDFRKALAENPSATLERYGIGHVDPEELRALYDPALAGKEGPTSPLVKAYREHIGEKLRWRDQIRRDCAPDDGRFRAWRERQMARCLVELGPELDVAIIHTPLAVELALGCSVQCWFCSLDAPKLQAVCPYDDTHAALWREMLATLKREVGAANQYGCLYWASEPLDNPDYEQFCDDFCDAFGIYPQTTTAAPVRNVERTRALLLRSREKGCRVNRFSVLSLDVLDRILDSFTAEELAGTELLHQGNGADSLKAAAGRSTSHFAEHPEALRRERQKIQEKLDLRAAATGQESPSNASVPMPGTTSCVTGFLINLVQKTVKLISPCYASERWPLGYAVFGEGTFADAEGFAALVRRLIDEGMEVDLPEDRELKFASSLRVDDIEEGFSLTGRYQRFDCKNAGGVAYLRRIGRLLEEGKNTASAISILCSYEFGVADALTRGVLKNFWQKGMLDEGI